MDARFPHLARTAARIVDNDNARRPCIGDRIERIAMCCDGGVDDVGTIVREQTNRWGTSWEIAFADGTTEWASSIDPAGTRGTGFRFAMGVA